MAAAVGGGPAVGVRPLRDWTSRELLVWLQSLPYVASLFPPDTPSHAAWEQRLRASCLDGATLLSLLSQAGALDGLLHFDEPPSLLRYRWLSDVRRAEEPTRGWGAGDAAPLTAEQVAQELRTTSLVEREPKYPYRSQLDWQEITALLDGPTLASLPSDALSLLFRAELRATLPKQLLFRVQTDVPRILAGHAQGERVGSQTQPNVLDTSQGNSSAPPSAAAAVTAAAVAACSPGQQQLQQQQHQQQESAALSALLSELSLRLSASTAAPAAASAAAVASPETLAPVSAAAALQSVWQRHMPTSEHPAATLSGDAFPQAQHLPRLVPFPTKPPHASSVSASAAPLVSDASFSGAIVQVSWNQEQRCVSCLLRCDEPVDGAADPRLTGPLHRIWLSDARTICDAALRRWVEQQWAAKLRWRKQHSSSEEFVIHKAYAVRYRLDDGRSFPPRAVDVRPATPQARTVGTLQPRRPVVPQPSVASAQRRPAAPQPSTPSSLQPRRPAASEVQAAACVSRSKRPEDHLPPGLQLTDDPKYVWCVVCEVRLTHGPRARTYQQEHLDSPRHQRRLEEQLRDLQHMRQAAATGSSAVAPAASASETAAQLVGVGGSAAGSPQEEKLQQQQRLLEQQQQQEEQQPQQEQQEEPRQQPQQQSEQEQAEQQQQQQQQ